MRGQLFVALSAMLVLACPPRRAVQEAAPQPTCFAATTEPRQDPNSFPHRFILFAGVDSGGAAWLPPSGDTSRLSRQARTFNWWRRSGGDSLRVLFGNGYSALILDLRGPDSLVTGRGQWYDHQIGQPSPPPLVVAATRVRC